MSFITKNLGQIKAIHIGVNPPVNITMLWYNTNPGQNKHYYYNTINLQWEPLTSSGSGSSYNFNDTNSIDFSVTGSNVSADVKLNSSVANKIQSTVSGLLVQETLTTIDSLTLVGNDIVLKYTGEDGTQQTKTVDISSALIDVNVANAVLNPSTYILTITETDGSTHTVNFSSLLQRGNLIFAIGNMNYPKATPNLFQIDENGTLTQHSDYSRIEYTYSDFINNFWNYGSGLLRFQTGNINSCIKINEFIRYINQTSADIIGADLQLIKDTLERGQDVIIDCQAKDSFNFFLPAPRISYVHTGQDNIAKVVHNSNQYEWEAIINGNNPNFSNPQDYFKRYFDIYFENFGNNEWRQLPELRVELCMLKHNSRNTGWAAGNPKNTTLSIGRGGKLTGLRDKFHKAIIHPRHVDYANRLTPGTTSGHFFSGGNGGNHPTEWTFDFQTVNSPTINHKHSNRTKNTNIRIMLDLLGFIRSNGQPYYSFTSMALAVLSKTYFKNTGYLKNAGTQTKSKQRSLRFYFRLSAADPTSWNSVKNRYNKRLYSDYSECVIATLKSVWDVSHNGRMFKQIDVKIV